MASQNSGSDIADVTDSFSFLNQLDAAPDADTRSVSSGLSAASTASKHSTSGLQSTEISNGSPTDNGVTESDNEVTNGVTDYEDDVPVDTSPKHNIDKSSKSKNPFKFLRRLTSKAELKNKNVADNEEKPKMSHFDKVLMGVKVDSLPQVFVTKYMGCKPCNGLWGIKHTRGPVDDMIKEITTMDPEAGEDLPLVQLRVSLSGIHIREHSANMCKKRKVEKEQIPIEFISYGVQDVKYTRVFTFILVREMSSKSRKLECHAYVCDSTANCRRLSLSVALAFQEYSKTLEGKPYKFKVDLTQGNETEQEVAEETAGGEDFEV